jgi:hypothetical protein
VLDADVLVPILFERYVAGSAGNGTGLGLNIAPGG